MRVVELLTRISLPITNEEAEILDMFDDQEEVKKSDLEPRQQLLANSLVNKDVLSRFQRSGKVTYRRKISHPQEKSH